MSTDPFPTPVTGTVSALLTGAGQCPECLGQAARCQADPQACQDGAGRLLEQWISEFAQEAAAGGAADEQ